MEPERNTETWNDDYQTQNQTNPCEQPQKSSFSQSQWLEQTWLNVKLTTWLKCFIIIAALSIAAVFIAPKFTSADNQQQDSTGYFEVEDDWYDDYDYYED